MMLCGRVWVQWLPHLCVGFRQVLNQHLRNSASLKHGLHKVMEVKTRNNHRYPDISFQSVSLTEYRSWRIQPTHRRMLLTRGSNALSSYKSEVNRGRQDLPPSTLSHKDFDTYPWFLSTIKLRLYFRITLHKEQFTLSI